MSDRLPVFDVPPEACEVVTDDWAFLSASGLERAERCPAACAIVRDPPEESAGSDADRGTLIHLFCERIALGDTRAQALAVVAHADRFDEQDRVDALGVCEQIDITAIPPGLPEVAFVYNVRTRTVRVVERAAHRDYGALGADEVPGTADLLVGPHANGGAPLVIDWKTGYESVPRARGCAQLEFHVLCLAALAGCDRVDVAIARIDGDGKFHWDLASYDALAIELAHDRVVRIVDGVAAARRARQQGAAAVVAEGAHCKWCPAKGSCPAYAAEVRALARIDDGWSSGIVDVLEDDAAAAFWFVKSKRAEEVLEKIRAALRARIDKRPVTLPDGATVRLAREQRSELDGRLAYALIKERYGADVADALADVKITQVALRAKLGDEAESVLRELAAAGAIARHDRRVLRVRKAAAA